MIFAGIFSVLSSGYTVTSVSLALCLARRRDESSKKELEVLSTHGDCVFIRNVGFGVRLLRLNVV